MNLHAEANEIRYKDKTYFEKSKKKKKAPQ